MSESLFIELAGDTAQVTLNAPINLSNPIMVLSQVSVLLVQATDTNIDNRVSELVVRSPVFGGQHPQVIQSTTSGGVATFNHSFNGITIPIDPTGAANAVYFVARNPHKVVPFTQFVPQTFQISVTLPNGNSVTSLPGASIKYVMLWFNFDSL